MSDTQRYTFTGINHRKDGELLESGTEVELTDSEYAAAPHKFEPVESDANADETADAADEAGEDGDATEATDFTDLDGVGPATADELHAAGYDSFADLREASVDDLTDVTNVSADDAESIHEQIDGSEG
jgi:predicted flap endonuclease-1-like 5' DNA nuclease